MRCWYCDGKLGFFQSLRKELFCSREHQELYCHEQRQLLAERVPPCAPSTEPPSPEEVEKRWNALRNLSRSRKSSF